MDLWTPNDIVNGDAVDKPHTIQLRRLVHYKAPELAPDAPHCMIWFIMLAVAVTRAGHPQTAVSHHTSRVLKLLMQLHSRHACHTMQLMNPRYAVRTLHLAQVALLRLLADNPVPPLPPPCCWPCAGPCPTVPLPSPSPPRAPHLAAGPAPALAPRLLLRVRRRRVGGRQQRRQALGGAAGGNVLDLGRGRGKVTSTFTRLTYVFVLAGPPGAPPPANRAPPPASVRPLTRQPARALPSQPHLHPPPDLVDLWTRSGFLPPHGPNPRAHLPHHLQRVEHLRLLRQLRRVLLAGAVLVISLAGVGDGGGLGRAERKEAV